MFISKDNYNNELPTYGICEQCGTQLPPEEYMGAHDLYCEYIHFQNKVAPAQGLHSLMGELGDSGRWIASILRGLNLPIMEWHFGGNGSIGYEVWSSALVLQAIKTYNGSGGYAGLTLEEYLEKMVTDANSASE